MASEIIVQNLKGPASGANANKIIVPSGHTLDASEGFTPPAGHVIDVKHVSLTASQTFNSTTYADVNNASITVTPASSSSKFLVMCVCQYYCKDNYTNGWQAFKLRLVRGSTELINDASYGVGIYNNPTNFYIMGKTSQAYLDSPATTSSITYKAQGSVNNTSHPSVSVNQYGHGYMFVQEIAG